jgi:ABC-type dipeptide/oligopeptide/nickel transport system permease component
MAHYLVVRVGSLLVSLIGATLVVFMVMHAIPGGPFNAQKSPNLTPEQVANINKFYHLDKPLPVQYVTFMWGALHLDFGESYEDPGEPISALLGRVWPISAFAGGMGILLGVSVGMLLGIAAALRRNSWIDYLANLISISSITLPSFVVSIGLLLLFAVLLRWFPASGWNGPSTWVLPVLAYAAIPIGPVVRYTRSSMLDMAARPYVTVARAKGLARHQVVIRHMLRNALRPIVTIVLPLLPGIMTGSIFVEYIFGVPGMGQYFVTSINNRDYPLQMALIFIVSILYGVFFLIADLIYILLDPRVNLVDGPSKN